MAQIFLSLSCHPSLLTIALAKSSRPVFLNLFFLVAYFWCKKNCAQIEIPCNKKYILLTKSKFRRKYKFSLMTTLPKVFMYQFVQLKFYFSISHKSFLFLICNKLHFFLRTLLAAKYTANIRPILKISQASIENHCFTWYPMSTQSWWM